jgi:broad specificity phosphatase PhoE
MALGRRPIVDERLAEIDYRLWGGLTNDEILECFGEEG